RQFLVSNFAHRLDTFEKYGKEFFALHGHRPVSALKPYHIRQWLDSHRAWGSMTKRNAASRVLACLNWGAESGLIETNPVREKFKLAAATRRGREMRLPTDLCDLLISCARSPRFRLLLRILRITGCRPIEIRMADIADFHGRKIVLRWNA